MERVKAVEERWNGRTMEERWSNGSWQNVAKRWSGGACKSGGRAVERKSDGREKERVGAVGCVGAVERWSGGALQSSGAVEQWSSGALQGGGAVEHFRALESCREVEKWGSEAVWSVTELQSSGEVEKWAVGQRSSVERHRVVERVRVVEQRRSGVVAERWGGGAWRIGGVVE